MAVILVVILLLLLMVSAYYILGRRRYNLPPGPRGYPIIGNILDLHGRDFRIILKEYRQKYGDIFTIRLFQKVYIICNGYELLKEMFVKNADNFSEKAHLGLFSDMHPGYGFISNGSQMWDVHRKFTIRTLRDLGMGKNLMQTRLKYEVNHLIKKIKEFGGKPFNINPLLHRSFGNSLFTMLHGKRFDDDDPLLDEIIERGHDLAGTLGLFASNAYKYIPGDPFGVRKFIKSEKRLLEIYSDMVDKHMDEYQDGTPTNLIDAYIKEIRESKGADRIMNKNEVVSVLDVIALGADETAPNIILWGLRYMLNDLSVQDTLVRELNDVISEDSELDFSDKKKLPYVAATINEMMRISSFVPFTEPRSPVRKSTFHGYDIPTDAFVLPCLDSVLLDETLWKEPRTFKPSRFLNDDGSVNYPQELIPFSLGKRKCPGESLGRMQLFLYFTELVRNFEFKIPGGEKPPSIDNTFALVLIPDDLYIQAIPRKKSA